MIDVSCFTPGVAYYYALKDPNTRLVPELEEIVRQSPLYSYLYAMDILRRRWTEAEEIIKTDSKSAYLYAIDVIQGRWTEAEDKIRSSSMFWENYCSILRSKHYTEEQKLEWLKAEGVHSANLLSILRQLGMGRLTQDFLLSEDFALHTFIQAHWAYDCSEHFQLRLLDLDPKNIFHMVHPSLETQESFIQLRPDLIDQVPDLDLSLKAKYSHEVELSSIDF